MRPEPNPFAAGCAHVDGEFVPVAEARIPLLDRGFTRSDATYDVTHVWKGYIFRLDDYLDRFERNVAALRMTLPLPRAEVRSVLIECVRRSGLRDAFVQMTCTRGIPPGGSRDPQSGSADKDRQQAQGGGNRDNQNEDLGKDRQQDQRTREPTPNR